jgi:hypothetical protein
MEKYIFLQNPGQKMIIWGSFINPGFGGQPVIMKIMPFIWRAERWEDASPIS